MDRWQNGELEAIALQPGWEQNEAYTCWPHALERSSQLTIVLVVGLVGYRVKMRIAIRT